MELSYVGLLILMFHFRKYSQRDTDGLNSELYVLVMTDGQWCLL